MASEITIKRGTPYSATVVFTDDMTAEPLNLTGKTVFFTVKKYGQHNATDDSTYLIKKDITTHTDPANGETTLVLTAVQTNIPAGTYAYDYKVYVSGVNINTDTGICIVEDIVTVRTT